MDQRLFARKRVLGNIVVLQQCKIGQDGVFLAVGGDHRHFMAHGAMDGIFLHRLPLHLQRAAGRGQNAENGLHQLADARALEARKADHFALADAKADVFKAVAGVIFQFQNRLAQFARGVDVGVGIAVAHHQFGHFRGRYIPYIAALDHAAVAQNSIAVGDLEDLRHLVGDKDEGLALIAQTAHDGEQMLNLLVVERRVGSSSMNSLALACSALAISRSCFLLVSSSLTGTVGRCPRPNAQRAGRPRRSCAFCPACAGG